ncbi:MAG: serine hydrolase domain-containing protein [bacterium]|nr:serine hydrolase domain-containing protein [bacterium]
MKKFILLSLLFLNLNVNAQTLPSKDVLFSKLKELKEQSKVNALIAGIWQGDQNILSVAFGESMTTVPADTSMHVRIGGITETFFGTLVMMLVDQGKFGLDDKISKWLPDLLEADKVTIGMLITNTSGYRDYVRNQNFLEIITDQPFREITRKEIIDFATSDGKMDFPPGTQQGYSHTSFTILGEVLEKATGKSLGELFTENIFNPLGLSHTGYNINADLPYPVLHAYSSDRGVYEDATFWSPSWTRDSGPIYSNLNDVAKWANVFGKGKLLTPESFNVLVSRPASAPDPNRFMASGFAVLNGWFAQNPEFNGYSGGFGYYPPKELTIIVFTTESKDRSSGTQAVNILQDISKMLTPDAPINFK